MYSSHSLTFINFFNFTDRSHDYRFYLISSLSIIVVVFQHSLRIESISSTQHKHFSLRSIVDSFLFLLNSGFILFFLLFPPISPLNSLCLVLSRLILSRLVLLSHITVRCSTVHTIRVNPTQSNPIDSRTNRQPDGPEPFTTLRRCSVMFFFMFLFFLPGMDVIILSKGTHRERDEYTLLFPPKKNENPQTREKKGVS